MASPPPPVPAASAPELRRRSFHPLELIPFFSRWPQGPVRDLVYSFLFNTLIAVGFTVLNLVFVSDLPIARAFFLCFVFSQCIGFTIWALVAVADGIFLRGRPKSAGVRWLTFVVIPLVGAYIGYWIATYVLGWSQARAELLTWRGVLPVLAVSGIITLILVAIFVPRDRAARAEARAARDEARMSEVEREATLARMQLLEAQIEPHFLYNTLAHVVSLVDGEPALAKRMLHRLIDLLRATAAGAQRASTVDTQLEHLRAYLELIAMRMGPRLAWSIEAAPDVRAIAIPPMLLQPVVENAIKHGLEPKVEGGRVDIAVTRGSGTLVLAVTDTGLGVSPTRAPGSTGIGLSNLRARLSALFGPAAALRIADHAPSGTRVTITLPLP